MRTRDAILRSAAALACVAAIFAAPARGQVGETFRLEAGKDLPHCEEDRASPLCQVERRLASNFRQPEPHEAPRVGRLIDWLFGLEGKRDASPRPPGRNSVVVPAFIHYHVERLETLDAAEIAALPTRWHPDSPPHGLQPGAVRVEILVAFEDAYGMWWPPKGWHLYEYLLREPDSVRGLHTEAVESSRTIALRWARSDCIGSAETPLCAVETFLACRIRRDSGGEEYVRYLTVGAADRWRVVGRSVVDWKSPQDPG